MVWMETSHGGGIAEWRRYVFYWVIFNGRLRAWRWSVVERFDCA